MLKRSARSHVAYLCIKQPGQLSGYLQQRWLLREEIFSFSRCCLLVVVFFLFFFILSLEFIMSECECVIVGQLSQRCMLGIV